MQTGRLNANRPETADLGSFPKIHGKHVKCDAGVTFERR